MDTLTLAVPESQLIEWVHKLSLESKQRVLKALMPDLDELDNLVDYGSQRMYQICAERGIDWGNLTEAEHQQLVDQWLHET